MNSVELVAVVMTLVGIVLTIKERISCWAVAGLVEWQRSRARQVMNPVDPLHI
jgi:hypothetical protein